MIEINNVESGTFEMMLSKLETMANRLEAINKKREDKMLRQGLGGDEVCVILRISPRTLQTYRENGTLPYSRIGNKMFYKPEDIESIIERVAQRHQKERRYERNHR